MRRKLIAGNWKMNLNWNEAMTHFTDVVSMSKGHTAVDVAVFPPSVYIRHFYEFAQANKSSIIVGAQDCSANEAGAFTGEVSSSMLKSSGATHCLIGHSERRQYHREGNEVLCKKLDQALANDLIPVFCCGESLEDRDNDNHNFVIDNQLDSTIFDLTEEQFSKIVIAYEPVWAIGTGRTASPDQAQDMHAFIRGLVQSKFGDNIASKCRILYGGSMNAKNASDLLSKEDVDGGLIGGASLKPLDFKSIIDAASAL